MRRLAIVLLAAGLGCNTRAQQCEKLVAAVNGAGEGLRAASSARANALDQTIFSIARSKAELAALDLSELDLDRDRLRAVRLLESDLAALRAFAAVRRNGDAADAEDALSRIEGLAHEERTLVEEINRHCSVR